jgi:hypothetical protein
MKKLLAMCLVLSMATLANAAVLDVVTYDVGLSGGRDGTPGNELEPSDIIGVGVVVAHNAYPGYPGGTYDGYVVSSVDLDLHILGPGSITVTTLKSGAPDVGTALDTLVVNPLPITDGPGIDRIQGISLGGIGAGAVIIDNILFHCDGPGPVLLDLTLLGLSEYAPYNDGGGGPWPGWEPMTELDLGDLVVYQIPEPITMVLLGLGSVGLLRRRR